MATHIKDILNTFFKETETKIKDKESIQKIIERELGENIKKRICVRGIEKEQVIIYVDSSSVKYEVSLKKKQLLEAIKKEVPKIGDIQITIE
ncbi:MAG: DciA family protein [Candidatus Omnitrophota bacterium]|nr:DUF721 domain-containing protein [Candidatus Omnitrophota bacterium]